MAKPTFQSCREVSTFAVNGQVYNQNFIKGNIRDLRKANLGRDNEGVYVPGTYGSQFFLYFGATLNPKMPGANKVIESACFPYVLFGDTALYGGDKDESSEYIFAQDHPSIKGSKIVMAQKVLESRLGSPQEGEVIFGSHGVRAMPRKSAYDGEFTSRQIKKVADTIVFLTGRKESPEEVAQIMRKIRKPGFLGVPSVGRITVPALYEGDDGLSLAGDDWDEFIDDWCSFGVRQ